jgi:hypothetical protein
MCFEPQGRLGQVCELAFLEIQKDTVYVTYPFGRVRLTPDPVG